MYLATVIHVMILYVTARGRVEIKSVFIGEISTKIAAFILLVDDGDSFETLSVKLGK